MANATMESFGYPDTLIAEYDHWAVLVRPAQVTLGSLVLVSRSEATALGALPAEAFAELGVIVPRLEAILKEAVEYEKINYLMLMMVDPHVHFHIFPRYEGDRSHDDLTIADRGWPGPPDLKSAIKLDSGRLATLAVDLKARVL